MNYVTACVEIHFQTLNVAHLVNCPLANTKSSLSFSQKPNTGPYSEPVNIISSQFINVHFNIILDLRIRVSRISSLVFKPITSTFLWRRSEIRVFLALCHTERKILINKSTGLKYMALRPSFCFARNNSRIVGRIFIKFNVDNIHQNVPL